MQLNSGKQLKRLQRPQSRRSSNWRGRMMNLRGYEWKHGHGHRHRHKGTGTGTNTQRQAHTAAGMQQWQPRLGHGSHRNGSHHSNTSVESARHFKIWRPSWWRPISLLIVPCTILMMMSRCHHFHQTLVTTRVSHCCSCDPMAHVSVCEVVNTHLWGRHRRFCGHKFAWREYGGRG